MSDSVFVMMFHVTIMQMGGDKKARGPGTRACRTSVYILVL